MEYKAKDWVNGRYPAAETRFHTRPPPADYGLLSKKQLAGLIEDGQSDLRRLKAWPELSGQQEYDELRAYAEYYVARLTRLYQEAADRES